MFMYQTIIVTMVITNSTCLVPGALLSVLHLLAYLIPITTLKDREKFLLPLYRK